MQKLSDSENKAEINTGLPEIHGEQLGDSKASSESEEEEIILVQRKDASEPILASDHIYVLIKNYSQLLVKNK